MSKDFNDDPRKQQELRCRPAADNIYRQAFGNDITILRDSDIVLDRDFAIDVRIGLSNGMVLLGQEKFLSSRYASFGTVTIEYYQDQFTKERGDWFKIGVQIYFVGYEHPKGFAPFVLLDWAKVTMCSDQNIIKWTHNVNKDGRAKASFAYTKIVDIPDSCIILKG